MVLSCPLKGLIVHRDASMSLNGSLKEDAQDLALLLGAMRISDQQPQALKLIEQKPHLSQYSFSNNTTPLIFAVCAEGEPCSLELFQALLNSPSTDVNAQNDKGYATIHFLALYNLDEHLKLLLTVKGLNLNLLTKLNDNKEQDSQFSAAYLAAVKGHYACLALLIEAGCDVNCRSGQLKRTPLHAACYWGFEHCVDLLLANKADIDAIDENGCTAAHLLSANQDSSLTVTTREQIIDKLKRANINLKIQTAAGNTAFDLSEHFKTGDPVLFSPVKSLERLVRESIVKGLGCPETEQKYPKEARAFILE